MKKIVFIGDSLTYGYGANPQDAWPAIAAQRLNYKYKCINKGENGDFTAGMSARFYRDVMALKPETVVILGGSNDILNRIPMNQTLYFIEEMTGQALDSDIEVIIGIPMSIDAQLLRAEGCPAGMVQQIIIGFENYHDALIDFCETKHIKYIDFWKEYPKRMEACKELQWYIDGVHPTKKGYRTMAEIFYETSGFA